MPDATSIGANELVSLAVGGTNTSFAYDAWGRMTSKSDGTYSATYAYRYGDKLASVMSDFPTEGNASYQYDGAGKRRQRTGGGTTTRYRWDVGWNVLNEEDNLGSLARTHIMDSPLAEVADILSDVAGANPATGAYRYYVSDHLGSTRGLYDDGKSALGGYEYSPYGELYANSGSVALEGLAAAFTGKPWDAAAQMYYFPYRWYSPSAARWLTRDPLGAVDGPNVYGYVKGSPGNRRDATGCFLSAVNDRIAGYLMNPSPRQRLIDWGPRLNLVLIPLALACAWKIGWPALQSVTNQHRGGQLAEHCLVACWIRKDCGIDAARLAARVAEMLTDGYFPWQWNEKELNAGIVGANMCDEDCVEGCEHRFPVGLG